MTSLDSGGLPFNAPSPNEWEHTINGVSFILQLNATIPFKDSERAKGLVLEIFQKSGVLEVADKKFRGAFCNETQILLANGVSQSHSEETHKLFQALKALVSSSNKVDQAYMNVISQSNPGSSSPSTVQDHAPSRPDRIPPPPLPPRPLEVSLIARSLFQTSTDNTGRVIRFFSLTQLAQEPADGTSIQKGNIAIIEGQSGIFDRLKRSWGTSIASPTVSAATSPVSSSNHSRIEEGSSEPGTPRELDKEPDQPSPPLPARRPFPSRPPPPKPPHNSSLQEGKGQQPPPIPPEFLKEIISRKLKINKK